MINHFRKTTLNDIHLVNCIEKSIEENKQFNNEINILEVGCGSGTFLVYMIERLIKKFNHINFSFYGFDIDESELTLKDQSNNTHLNELISLLNIKYPNHDWAKRVRLIKETDEWHDQESYFDFIISNQVLEHVHNKEVFFQKLKRYLKRNGNSFHLAPLSSCLLEWHIFIPFAHWPKSINNKVLIIRMFYFLKSPIKYFKEYNKYQILIKKESNFLQTNTSYSSTGDYKKLCLKNSLKLNLKYTYAYYLIKICTILKLDINKYNFYNNSFLLHYLSYFICSLTASVTLNIKNT